ncbi:hypothetical protein DRN73_08795 [Candidatus Pacearchaeota archaeon]|nr:MAG: hypothetical protein DRN73_08795 [Candidatus Pacearchaeota archaeon]
MDFWELLKESWRSLASHKTRSFLTTLGVVVAVSSVIAMASIIEGINNYAYKLFGGMGANLIYIEKYEWTLTATRGWWKKFRGRKDFTLEDGKAIEKLECVEKVYPQFLILVPRRVGYKNQKVDLSKVVGVVPGAIKIHGFDLDKGRDILNTDLIYRRRVCVIGSSVARTLFKDENPLGKFIKLGKYRFEIVGVLASQGKVLGQDVDNVMFIPLNTAMALYKRPSRRALWASIFQTLSFVAKVRQGYSIEKAMEEIETLLRERRGVPFNEDNDFSLNTSEKLVSMYNKLTRGIFLAMIGITSLALIVGGIGIMNIMLVSVRERTREIGIRMAIGARRRDILMQFLAESVALTFSGGLIGLLVGGVIAYIVSVLTPLPAKISPPVVLLAIFIAIITGVIFGIYPANVASKMNPVEALRYE